MADQNFKKDNTSHKNKQNKIIQKELNIIYLLPMIFIVAVLPLIVKIHEYKTDLAMYDWFSENDSYFDFFLYYKQAFLIGTAVIILILTFYYKYIKKEQLSFTFTLIPLGIYALLAFLSSLFSDHRYFAFKGVFEQFESILALLAYCIILYCAYSFVQSERDLKCIINSLLASVLSLTFISITQILGHDFYRSQLGWQLISNSTYLDYKDQFIFASQAGRSYISFYNPNYVGMYVALVFPIMFLMSLFTKKVMLRSLFLVGALGLIICLYGSKSTSGLLGIVVSFVLSIILLWRTFLKYLKITIPVIIIIVLALFVLNFKTNYFNVQINKIVNLKKTSSPMLREIQTNNDNLVIKYNGNTINVTFNYDSSSGLCTFNFLDENNIMIASNLEVINGPLTIMDERFPNFIFTPTMIDDNTLGFSVLIDNKPWYFTNQYKDNTYYYINDYGKYTKISTAPSAVFTGYELYATGRGYIWSRTMPLLKDTILLGTGADTFIFTFPQSDYVNLYNYGFTSQLMTKPHSLYLQIAVQTGVISLISFLALYLMYFISSLRIYINRVFTNIYTVAGAAILLGTTGYMICAIANDSSVTVAPIFWLLLGVGLAMNQINRKNLQTN